MIELYLSQNNNNSSVGYGKYYGSKDDDKSNGYYTED